MSYDHMWEFIKSYRLKIDLESPWLCVLCHQLLIDTYEGPCGCIFCKQCIINYLKDNTKFCPSNSDNCKSIKLNFKENIFKVKSIDKKISELKIQCPLELCDYKTEIINMFNHIKDCDKRVICCPYSEVGCPIKEMKNESLPTHLLDESNNHNYLLMRCISSFKKRIDDMNNRRTFQNNLTKENNKTQRLIENLSKEIQSIKSSVINIGNKCNNQEKNFEQWKENFQSSLGRLQDEYMKINKPQRKRKLDKSDRVDLDQSNNLIKACEYRQKIYSKYTWKIIDGLKKKSNIFSEDFFTKNNVFKIKLKLTHKNKNELGKSDVRIRLLIKYNLNDETFQDGVYIPFYINLIVKNMNSIFPCKKSKPFKIKVFKYFKILGSFEFSDDELKKAAVNPCKPIFIECKFEVN